MWGKNSQNEGSQGAVRLSLKLVQTIDKKTMLLTSTAPIDLELGVLLLY